jgi:hypothetical protein
LVPTAWERIGKEMAMTTLVYLRHGDETRPVVKVVERENPDDVTIMIRSEADEHLSLHRTTDGGILLTYYNPALASSVHDKARVSAARAHGYGDPERHGKYIAHWPVWPKVIGMDGYELCRRRIYLEQATAKRKYERMARIEIDAPATEFMLTFILATPEQPYSRRDEPHVSTSFGDLYFRPESGAG